MGVRKLCGMSNPVRTVIELLLNGASVLVVAAILPGMRVRSYFDAVGFAVVVAILNALVWKVFGIVTVPLAWLTLGLFGLIFNAMIFLVARKVVRGVEISGWFTAMLASILVYFCNRAIHLLVP